MNCEVNEENIKQLTGFKPKNIDLYRNAFVHKSLVKELQTNSNERLEFVGDSVIGLIVAQYLYDKYPDEDEGFLTKIRTKIVSSKGLSTFAKKLEFHKYVMMNQKAMNNEWNKNQRILEDAFEAFIGALFMDRGLDVCKKFLIKVIKKYTQEEVLTEDTNYKDLLMKHVHTNKLGNLVYKLTHQNGPEHSKKFTIQLEVNNRKISEGTGSNKKEAEQKAAFFALSCLT